MTESDEKPRQVIPPYPHDGGALDRAAWMWLHGPFLLMVLIAALLIGLGKRIKQGLAR